MLASKYFEEAGVKGPHLELFAEMCRRVGTTLDDPRLDVGDARVKVWHFEAFEWTEKEEADFAKWALTWIFTHKFHFGHRSKRVIKAQVLPMWLLNYSWRYKT